MYNEESNKIKSLNYCAKISTLAYFFSNLAVVREAKVTNVKILGAKEVQHLSGAGDQEPIHHHVAPLQEVLHQHVVVAGQVLMVVGVVGEVVVWGYPRDTVSMLDT